MRAFLACLFLVAACAHAPAPSVGAAPVIAAERAFAADAAVRGWVAAFRSAAAPDATMLAPGPVNAHEHLAQIEGDGTTALDWRPAFAGIARSADFGFTTGPFQLRGREGIAGHYFTVWRLQPDGQWKWIFDAGTAVRDPGPAVAVDAAIPTLAVAASGVGSARAAIEEVSALERRIFRARPEPRRQMIARLGEAVRLNRPGRAAAVGRAAAAEAASATALDPSETPLRIEASAAGDMVFVLGRTAWPDGDGRREGYSARMWQRQGDGWRIVFDEIVPGDGG